MILNSNYEFILLEDKSSDPWHAINIELDRSHYHKKIRNSDVNRIPKKYMRLYSINNLIAITPLYKEYNKLFW
jgi:hypothetical protein